MQREREKQGEVVGLKETQDKRHGLITVCLEVGKVAKLGGRKQASTLFYRQTVDSRFIRDRGSNYRALSKLQEPIAHDYSSVSPSQRLYLPRLFLIDFSLRVKTDLINSFKLLTSSTATQVLLSSCYLHSIYNQ